MSRCSALLFVVCLCLLRLFCFHLLRLCLFFFFRHYLCCFAYCNSIGTDTAEIVFFQTIPRHIQQHFSCRCTKRCLRPGCKCRNKKAAQKQNPSAKLLFFMITSFQFKCSCIKLIIFAFFSDQLIVRSSLNNTSLLQHHYNIRISYCRQSVCNNKYGTSFHQSIHTSLYDCLCSGINRRRSSSRIITGGSATAALAIAIS